MRFFLIFLAIIFIAGCYNSFSNLTHKPRTKQSLVNEVERKVAFRLKKEKELYTCGTGGQMMDQIKMLALSFDYYKPLNIENGRELLIAAVNELVTHVNANEEIRPYLNNYPFEPKNIEIRIFARNPDGSNVPPGKLSVLSAIRNIFEYDMNDPETIQLKTFYQETYEEALSKIAAAAKSAA